VVDAEIDLRGRSAAGLGKGPGHLRDLTRVEIAEGRGLFGSHQVGNPLDFIPSGGLVRQVLLVAEPFLDDDVDQGEE